VRERLAPGWGEAWEAFSTSAQGLALLAFVAQRRAEGAMVYPPQPLRALELTARSDVRVAILGQDPYHGPGQADGLAFSVPDGVRMPPSLRNLFAELAVDCGVAPPSSGNLERWARQGVLLLNTVLTVEDGAPGCHAGRGWETLTAAIVGSLARDARPKVFMLWGAHAQARRGAIEAARSEGTAHLVLMANHPSPLAARRPPVPFIGCRHFSQANAFLNARGRGVIDW
jgi:uracil-DNA glycosylase